MLTVGTWRRILCAKFCLWEFIPLRPLINRVFITISYFWMTSLCAWWSGVHKSWAPRTAAKFCRVSTNICGFFYVLLTVHLSITLDNDQLDAHLIYFTIRPLQSSVSFEHYMLIIRRLNCIDAASGIVLSVSGHPVHRTATDWEWRYQMLHQYNSISWWACNARNT